MMTCGVKIDIHFGGQIIHIQAWQYWTAYDSFYYVDLSVIDSRIIVYTDYEQPIGREVHRCRGYDG